MTGILFLSSNLALRNRAKERSDSHGHPSGRHGCLRLPSRRYTGAWAGLQGSLALCMASTRMKLHGASATDHRAEFAASRMHWPATAHQVCHATDMLMGIVGAAGTISEALKHAAAGPATALTRRRQHCSSAIFGAQAAQPPQKGPNFYPQGSKTGIYGPSEGHLSILCHTKGTVKRKMSFTFISEITFLVTFFFRPCVFYARNERGSLPVCHMAAIMAYGICTFRGRVKDLGV